MVIKKKKVKMKKKKNEMKSKWKCNSSWWYAEYKPEIRSWRLKINFVPLYIYLYCFLFNFLSFTVFFFFLCVCNVHVSLSFTLSLLTLSLTSSKYIIIEKRRKINPAQQCRKRNIEEFLMVNVGGDECWWRQWKLRANLIWVHRIVTLK